MDTKCVCEDPAFDIGGIKGLRVALVKDRFDGTGHVLVLVGHMVDPEAVWPWKGLERWNSEEHEVTVQIRKAAAPAPKGMVAELSGFDPEVLRNEVATANEELNRSEQHCEELDRVKGPEAIAKAVDSEVGRLLRALLGAVQLNADPLVKLEGLAMAFTEQGSGAAGRICSLIGVELTEIVDRLSRERAQ